jgi:Domain of unknown function (DUF4351)
VAEDVGRQAGLVEGEQLGEVKEAKALILRQLKRRVGTVSIDLESQVKALSLEQFFSTNSHFLFRSDSDRSGIVVINPSKI